MKKIISCKIVETTFGEQSESFNCIKIVGTGFLKHMVRYIAGEIFAVGQGKKSP